MLYTAVHRDELILSEPELGQVLSLLADLQDCDEDCAVWHRPHVVCVRHGPGGRVTWLRPEHRAAAEAA